MIYDIDVSCNIKWDQSRAQLATSKQLNDIGLTCKQWVTAPSSELHRWRVWITDPSGSGLSYLKQNYPRITVVNEDIPIPAWCRFPSKLNAKLIKDDHDSE